MNLWVIFLTGLTVGSLTCLAVQGGLLASVIAAKEGEEVERGQNKRDSVFPTLAFLTAKLIAYTILGLLLGAFGEVISVSQTTQTMVQFVSGLYMIAVALSLLNVHPIFRYVVIQPPMFLTRKVKSVSKRRDLFAPALLGVMTVFIPCGTTLAMEALAIGSASPFLGAAVMATFVLGTSPLFFGVGWITSVLGDNYREKFLKLAAIAVIYLGISTIYGTFVLAGLETKKSEKLYSEVPISHSVEINVTANGYSPNYIKVKKDSLVTLTLVGKNTGSCASSFRVPELGVSKNLLPNEIYTFSFTPRKVGKITFTCSMGMYSGTIEVI